MRILVLGSGGVGDAVARIAARRDFFELLVVADVDPGRARRTVDAASAHDVVGGRFVAASVDASSPAAVEALVREHGMTHVLNAVDPRFVMPIFGGAKAADADYLDMAMSLSHPHPSRRTSRRASSSATSSSPRRTSGKPPVAWRLSASVWSPGCRTSRGGRRRPPVRRASTSSA